MTVPRTLQKITAAVAFDENLELLTATAASLARACNATLRLLHVCDPWNKSGFASSIENSRGDFIGAIRQDMERSSRHRLELLRSSIPDSVPTEISIIHDETIAGICEDAKASATDLLVVGAHHRLNASPRGIADAINVVVDSEVPTLIVHEDCRPKFTRDRLRIGIADDFALGGDSALRFGASLASSGTTCDLIQIHVQESAEMRSSLRQKPYGEGDDLPDFAAKLQQTRQQLVQQIESRGKQVRAMVEGSGGRYFHDLAFGSIATEIDRSANAFRCDFIIFGKHRMFHREQLSVGKVPFKTMLQQDRAIIIVP